MVRPEGIVAVRGYTFFAIPASSVRMQVSIQKSAQETIYLELVLHEACLYGSKSFVE
jgi:hypothetical protein